MLGRTTREAKSDKNIIMAVSWPYEENMGIGAMPIIAKPTMLEAADATNANPVPLAAVEIALKGSWVPLSSSRYL
tara:strand:+ start:410 stop:634 length:225 start_codon:yes stop_codon:yes gene_type:complete